MATWIDAVPACDSTFYFSIPTWIAFSTWNGTFWNFLSEKILFLVNDCGSS